MQFCETMKSQWLAPNVMPYTSLLCVCAKGGRTERALQIVEALHAQRLTPNVITCSTLLRAGTTVEQAEHTRQLFGTMQSQRLVLNMITYTAFSVFAGRVGDPAGIASLRGDAVAVAHAYVVTDNLLIFSFTKGKRTK